MKGLKYAVAAHCLFLFFAVLVVGLLTSGSGFAQLPANNPVSCFLRYSAIYKEAGKPDMLIAGGQRPIVAKDPVGAWIPQFDPWHKTGGVEDRKTSKNHRIENVDSTGIIFPFADQLNRQITAPASDAFWEEPKFGPYRAANGFTKVAGSTSAFDQNCYGYATGLGYWIGTPGFNTITKDEYRIYQGGFCKAGGIIQLANDHCVLIINCCPKCTAGKRMLYTTREKNNSSAIYERVYDCSNTPGFIPGGTIWYKP